MTRGVRINRMLLIAGLILTALGFISGGALLASSIGWITTTSGPTLWILFPLASFGGLLLSALGARTHSLPVLTKSTATVMLLLALAAVIALVMTSIGVLPAPQSVSALWYVFAVGLLSGSAGFLSAARPGEPA